MRQKVTNGASFVPVSQPDHAIAPGEIASLFGSFGNVTAVASSFPLPYMLGGASVTLADVPAPILYAAPGQINIEVPNSPPGSVFSCNSFAGDCYGQASLVVTVNGRTEPATNVDFIVTAPMLFTRTGTGCGPGAVLNVSANGTTSVNSPANSASPGDFIEVFGSGLGAVTPVPTDSLPSPSNPPSISEGLYLGPYYEFDGEPATGSFAGRAPGLAGVDQYNIRIPDDVRQGCAVPLRVGASYNNSQSQPVTVSIHSGGGQCVDPPVWAYGKIVIKKSVVLNDSTAGETDTFTATFPAAPALAEVSHSVSENSARSFRTMKIAGQLRIYHFFSGSLVLRQQLPPELSGRLPSLRVAGGRAVCLCGQSGR